MAEVLLQGVYKYYDKNPKPAVADFNLEIADKEFVVFVGPSGCGKSTTLRMIAGLEEISEGDIYIGEKLVNDVEPKDRDIAMVFQNYALYPHMTVYENIAFGLRMKKIETVKVDKQGNVVLDKDGNPQMIKRHYTKQEIDEKVMEAARTLEITEYLKRKPKALSGGQRQRVAIGRAIVRKPKVFLMDEPLSNLDAKLRNQMRSEIILLRKRINTTFIYVTHDQTEAMTLGDRIVIMKDGVIQQVGTPVEVFNQPANLFVAGFIGTPQMNFFDAVLHCGKQCSVELCGKTIALNDRENAIIKEKGFEGDIAITLGVRPEHIEVGKKGPSSITAKVALSEMMGSEIHVHATVEDKDMIIRVPVVGVPEKDFMNTDGEQEIEFNVLPESMHMFFKETGDNVLY